MSEDLKLLAVRRRLENDLLASDIQWSLLTAAALSYRHDTVLRPFPPMFVKQNGLTDLSDAANADNNTTESRNYAQLMKALSRMPSLSLLTTTDYVPSDVVDLLHWTLHNKSFSISTCDDNKYSEIVELTGQFSPVSPPTHVFAVTYSELANARFDERRGDRSLIYAYHGSRLENFHSILHYGLQGHMTKNALFGEGTYLSSELSVCLHYSPNGTGWDRSIIGPQLSCVAVCEIIDDSAVKCKVHSSSDADARGRIAGSIGGDVPEKYYVVQNNELVRVKYLLVYVSRTSTPTSHTVSWFRRHLFAVIIALYLLLLLSLGLFNSNAFASMRRRITSKW